MAKETGARSNAVSEESACNQSSPSRPVGSVPASCHSCPDQAPHHTPGVLRSDFQQRAAPAIASSPLVDGTKHLGTGYEASQAQNAHSSESDRNCMTGNRTSASKHSPVQTPDPGTEMQTQRQDRELKLQHLISMKTVVFIILAIITRLWILMYFEQQSIIVVFCITEGLLFYFQIDQAPLQSSAQRVLSAMLTLKGASAESIARFQECVGFVQAAIQDFVTFLLQNVKRSHSTTLYNPELDNSAPPSKRGRVVPEFELA
ncbi:uncharacterized protein [Diadema antillarum]|uniref:uncharacterized protein n=1 Tax=Diadema antillarum TaxID=105358 RepID=UPI003A886CDC